MLGGLSCDKAAKIIDRETDLPRLLAIEKAARELLPYADVVLKEAAAANMRSITSPTRDKLETLRTLLEK